MKAINFHLSVIAVFYNDTHCTGRKHWVVLLRQSTQTRCTLSLVIGWSSVCHESTYILLTLLCPLYLLDVFFTCLIENVELLMAQTNVHVKGPVVSLSAD